MSADSPKSHAVYAKDNFRYWNSRVERRVTAGVEAANFSVRLCIEGRREWFNLETGNRELAAKKAVEIYRDIRARGWDQVLPDHKKRIKDKDTEKALLTLGDFIAAMEKYSSLRASTLHSYISKTRTVTAKLFNVDGADRYNHFSESSDGKTGNQRWREKVDAVLLDELVHAPVEQWFERELAKRRHDAAAQNALRNTIITTLRNARSFFCKKNTRGLAQQPADPRPFTGFKIGAIKVAPYKSTFSARNLLAAAKVALSETSPDAYMCILLAELVGMRRGEIDRLERAHIDFEKGVINIMSTEFGRPKSRHSEQGIPLGADLLEALRVHCGRGEGRFVISPEIPPLKGFSPSQRYRCITAFATVCAWLGGQGLARGQRLQTLRKEFGSVVNKKHGIHAASTSLRHADIQTTAKFYVDNRVDARLNIADF